MNSSSLIKWVLIAGAAYLVYRYLDQAGYFGTSATALPSGTPATGVAVSSASTVQSSNLLLAPPGATATVSPAQPATPVQSEVIVTPAATGTVIGPPATSGGQPTLYALPTVCQNVGSAQQGAQCSAAMQGFRPASAAPVQPSLEGYDSEDTALPSMDDLLALLGPYRARWGNA